MGNWTAKLAICVLDTIKCFADMGRIKVAVGKMVIESKVVRVRETSWFGSCLLTTTCQRFAGIIRVKDLKTKRSETVAILISVGRFLQV